MKRIESKDNPTYRAIAALRQTRRRRELGLAFLEGSRLCADALQSGASVEQALLSDSAADSPSCRAVLDLLPAGIEPISLPDRLFNALCETEQPQGVAMVCRAPLLAAPSAGPADRGLYLVAENIQDPGNLGTMIRTADAFAFDGVILTDGTVYPFNSKVLRAAMGSCFHLPLLAFADIEAVADWLGVTSRRASLLAADPSGPESLSTEMPLPAALVIGNEAKGLSPVARRLCTSLVAIMMPGRAESLNASAAAAILCHEMMKIRAHT